MSVSSCHVTYDICIFLIDPSFRGVKRLFVLSFKNENDRSNYKRYNLPIVEIKDYNVMIDGRNLFQRKGPTDQGDDYTTGCLLDYP